MEKKNYTVTFRCRLMNKKETEEDFLFIVTIAAKLATLVLAKRELRAFLRVNFGVYAEQLYFKERMQSEAYWILSLESVTKA